MKQRERRTLDVYRRDHLCQTKGHDFAQGLVSGWFTCRRPDCRQVAYCPGCLGRTLTGSVVRWCSLHVPVVQ